MTRDTPTGPPGGQPERDPVEAEVEASERRAAAERDASRPLAPQAGALERFVSAVTGTSVVVTLLAVLIAVILGGLIIAVSAEATREALGYFLSRPGDTFTAGWEAAAAAYAALVRGAVGGPSQLSETFTAAIPLILTGLAVAIPLRAGLFNIGGEGQVVAGGVVAGVVGFTLTGLPLLVHLPLALAAGLVGGALWGWLPGLLKARTGAHEVITTIMLNNIALLATDWLLTTTALRQPGRADPISRTVAETAQLPRLLPGSARLHAGLLVAAVVAVVVWWLLERSATGFEMTAVGRNPDAATAAGMSVGRAVMLAMAAGGALAGLAGTSQVLGVQYRVTSGFSSGLGFDGITVALLGRGGVGGTVAAGVLFGAFKAGGRAMQAQTQTSLDLVVVIQALIILFIAAPALIRALFRIQAPAGGAGRVTAGWGT